MSIITDLKHPKTHSNYEMQENVTFVDNTHGIAKVCLKKKPSELPTYKVKINGKRLLLADFTEWNFTKPVKIIFERADEFIKITEEILDEPEQTHISWVDLTPRQFNSFLKPYQNKLIYRKFDYKPSNIPYDKAASIFIKWRETFPRSKFIFAAYNCHGVVIVSERLSRVSNGNELFWAAPQDDCVQKLVAKPPVSEYCSGKPYADINNKILIDWELFYQRAENCRINGDDAEILDENILYWVDEE